MSSCCEMSKSHGAAGRHRKHRNRLSAAVWNQQNTATYWSFISNIYFSCDENMILNIYICLYIMSFFNLLYLCVYLFILLFINSSLISFFHVWNKLKINNSGGFWGFTRSSFEVPLCFFYFWIIFFFCAGNFIFLEGNRINVFSSVILSWKWTFQEDLFLKKLK